MSTNHLQRFLNLLSFGKRSEARSDVDGVVKNGATTIPSGSAITKGTTLTFTYTVKNAGNIALSTVGVTTNDNISVTCQANTLAAGATTTCSGSKTF